MDDLISRQAAIDAVIEDWHECCGVYDADTIIHDVTDIIENLPSVQPKHGEWKYHSNPTIGINPEDAYCSCCGFHVDTTGDIDFDEYNFCPRCGAKMEG